MIGAQLAHFKITAELGQGGMGKVYRAQDSKLGREVAIKVLPEGLTANAERLARFEREARVLASLNHSNIAAIYEVGEASVATDDAPPVHFLVMELVEGETLGERVGAGAVAVDDAIQIALQIAEALEAAHEKGIIHRDLKPANVKVTADDKVKVLDFGLAKAFDSGGGRLDEAGLTQSPTLSAQMTGAGVILGTAAYMAPEQAKGLEADKRSDIWAFGVVLTEMLTGRKAFAEDTVSETLAAVLKSEPDLGRLPAGVPASLRRLIERCLRKDPRERLHDIADARLVLEDIVAGRDEAPEEAAAAARFNPALAAGLVVAGAVIGALAMVTLRPAAKDAAGRAPSLQYVIEYGDFHNARPAVSPEGHRVAYERDGAIWVRDLGQLTPVRIADTEDGTVPFWSPDGEWLGFSAQDRLWKIKLDGTGKTVLCSPGPGALAGGAVWLEDGRILFDTGGSGIYEVPDRGGDARIVLEPEEGEADFHYLAALPDGKGFLFNVHAGDVFDNITLWTGSDRLTVLELPGQALGSAAYSPTGHILFGRSPQGMGIWAVPFAVDRLETTGEAFPVAPRGQNLSVARNGTMAYVPSAPRVLSELVILDRNGNLVQTVGAPRLGLYPSPTISPDGRSIVLPIGSEFGYDLWRYDLEGGEPSRLTFGETETAVDPIWSPDGREIYFSWGTSTEDFAVRVVGADGGGTMTTFAAGRGPVAFTGDDEIIWGVPAEGFNWNLWRGPIDDPGDAKPILAEAGWEQYPVVSADGRLLAYEHESELFIRALPDVAGPWQVSNGGLGPKWDRDRNRLYYRSGQDVMEVDVTTEPSVRVGTPRRLFSVALAPSFPTMTAMFDVGPDDTFIVVRPIEPPPGIVVVQNWLGTVE